MDGLSNVPKGQAVPKQQSVNEFLQQSFGANLASAPDADGFATIVDSSGAEREVNINKFIEDQKAQNPKLAVDTKTLSSPDAPLANSGLSFLQQMKLAAAPSDKEKYNALVDEFGSSKVKRLADGRVSVLGEDGTWREGKADNMIAEFAGRDASATAGAIAGATYGAAGGLVGSVIGAGAGALIGKYLNIKTAEKLGIRDERDEMEVSKELASEALFAMAGESLLPIAGKAISSGARLAMAAKATVPKLGSPASKRVAAQTISTITQEPFLMSAALINNTDDVLKNIKRLDAHQEAAFAKGTVSGVAGLDPVTKDQLDMTTGLVKEIKDSMIKNWDNFNASHGQALERAHLDVATVEKAITEPLKQLGLVGGDGKWLANIERLEKVSPIVKASDLNALKSVVNQVEALKRRGAGAVASKEAPLGVSVKELTRVIQGVDSLVAARPVIGMEVTSDTARALFKIRSDLRTAVSGTLHNSQVPGMKQAGAAYDALTGQYSQQSRFLDEIASEIDDGSRVARFVKNFVSGNGDRVDYTNLTNLVGSVRGEQAAQAFADKMVNLEAAKRFQGIYGNRPGLSSVGLGPKNIARMTGIVDRLTSKAQGVNGMMSMPKGSLAKNPSAVQEIWKTVSEAPAIRSTINQSLMQGASQAISGGGQK